MTVRVNPGIRLPVDRPWEDYPVGTKAFGCLGGHWVKRANGWQYNGRHGTFSRPPAEACCVELPNENICGERSKWSG